MLRQYSSCVRTRIRVHRKRFITHAQDLDLSELEEFMEMLKLSFGEKMKIKKALARKRQRGSAGEESSSAGTESSYEILPSQFGDYTCIEFLGNGAFGKAYKVQRNGDDKVYVVKAQTCPDNATKNKVQQEVRPQLSFTHLLYSSRVVIFSSLAQQVEALYRVPESPHLMRIHKAFFCGEDKYCIVTEFCEGGNSCLEYLGLRAGPRAEQFVFDALAKSSIFSIGEVESLVSKNIPLNEVTCS